MIIPQAAYNTLIEIYHNATVDMIDSYFGVPCVLTFGTSKSVCTNCNYNPITKKSSNTYKAGGPIEFDGGICPYCDGEGFTYLETTETIKLRAYYDKKKWLKVPVPVSIADGAIQTIGHIRDMAKCNSCKYIIINTDVSGIITYKYTIAGEPLPHGLDGQFFVAFWNRIN